jgi:hypothetical protein
MKKTCKHCGYTWQPRIETEPKACPQCKNQRWAEEPRKAGRPKEVLAKLYYYDGGQTIAEFRRGGAGDWFVWAPKRGQRLATYQTKKELMAAYARSNNTDGGYGCALLKLYDFDE